MHIILDARELGEKEKAHSYLKRMFEFPDHYGANLDALYDCLSSMDGPYIHIAHSDEAGEYFGKILSVLEDLDQAVVCCSEILL